MPKKFGFTSIKTLIDWAIDEGNRLFAGTPHANTWVIYHDALSQWWEKDEGGAQAYLASRGFEHRQWRARGATNDKIADNYKDKLMGEMLQTQAGATIGLLLGRVERAKLNTDG